MGVAGLERRLGSNRLDVRLSAIDALERIMIDSARDHPAIVKLLATFIRECAPVAASGPGLDSGGQPEPHPRPTADSQTVLNVTALVTINKNDLSHPVRALPDSPHGRLGPVLVDHRPAAPPAECELRLT